MTEPTSRAVMFVRALEREVLELENENRQLRILLEKHRVPMIDFAQALMRAEVAANPPPLSVVDRIRGEIDECNRAVFGERGEV